MYKKFTRRQLPHHLGASFIGTGVAVSLSSCQSSSTESSTVDEEVLPDFESDASSTIERLEMAYIAYNRLDQAEFILRRPTPITDDTGKELCRVLYYSETRPYPAKNWLIAGEA